MINKKRTHKNYHFLFNGKNIMFYDFILKGKNNYLIFAPKFKNSK
jgi:hypothetical protein